MNGAPTYLIQFKYSNAQFAETLSVSVSYRDNAWSVWNRLQGAGFIMVSERPGKN